MAISDEDLALQRGLSVELVQRLCQTRGTSNESLEQAPDAAIRRALRRLSYPDLARARQQHLLKQSLDDDGKVPAEALSVAVEQVSAMRASAVPGRGRPLRILQSRGAGVPVVGPVSALALLGEAPPPRHRWPAS